MTDIFEEAKKVLIWCIVDSHVSHCNRKLVAMCYIWCRVDTKKKYFATCNSFIIFVTTSFAIMLMNSSLVANDRYDVLPLPESPCRDMCSDRNGTNLTNNSNAIRLLPLFG